MDFSWKSAILHAIYARVSAAMPVACTVLLVNYMYFEYKTLKAVLQGKLKGA